MTDRTKQSQEIPLRWFAGPLLRYVPLYVELVIIAICLRLLTLVEPFVFQVLIDRVLPFQREASLVVVVVVLAGASLFHIGFDSLSRVLGALTANRVTQEFGDRIHDHLFKLPYSAFRRYTVGQTLARVRETDTIREVLVGTTTSALLDIIFVVIYLSVLLMISPVLTLVVLVALPLQALVYMAFGPPLRRRLRDAFDEGAKFEGALIDNVAGVAALKSLNAEREATSRLSSLLKADLGASLKVTLLNIWSDQLTFAIERGVTIAILFFGASQVFQGDITLGQLVAFYLVAEYVTDPIANFSSLWEAWQNLKISRQRLGDIVNVETEPFGRKAQLPADIKPQLSLENVTFGYNPKDPVLSEISFTASADTFNLIVGKSGVGKSTLGKLAAGLEVPQSGKIKLGRLDLSQYDPHSVRSKIGYVPQQPYLFEGTIRDNLMLGNSAASTEQIDEALELAAVDFVGALPQGIHAQVGERGSALSGGQQQRISIARSLLRRPRVLILDEPTSALDPETEQRLLSSIRALQGVTVIVITHRPEVIRDPDQVFLLGSIDD